MRIVLVVVAAAALAACDSGPPGRPRVPDNSDRSTREVQRMPAEVVQKPRGVAVVPPGPVCVLVETTGGAYGKPRFTVHLSTEGEGVGRLAGTARVPAVFFELEVESEGRRYDGHVSTAAVIHHESGLEYLPPIPATSLFSMQPMAPRDVLGVQEVGADLQACRLKVLEPDDQQRALGGMLVQTDEGRGVVYDKNGTLRSLDEA